MESNLKTPKFAAIGIAANDNHPRGVSGTARWPDGIQTLQELNRGATRPFVRAVIFDDNGDTFFFKTE